MLSGRVAFSLGLAVGLLAVVALQRRRTSAAVALAVLTSLASPVAGSFLALAGVAYALAGLGDPAGGRGQTRRGLAVAAAALAPILLLTLAFPEGGWEPFAPSVFWPGLAGVALIALTLPRVAGSRSPRAVRVLTWGAWLYAVALVGAFALHTPVGSNAARLGALFAAPLVAGVLWEHHRLALLLLAPVLLYWQLETPLNDVSELVGDPSVNASYYAPLVGELKERAGGAPLRVEVPMVGTHWESVYLPEHGSILLARGWERQLDTRYAGALLRRRRRRASTHTGRVPGVAVRKRGLLRGAARCAPGLLRRRGGTADRARAALPARSVALGALAPLRRARVHPRWRAPQRAHRRRCGLLHARRPTRGQLHGARALHPLLGARPGARVRAQRARGLD